MNTLSTETNTEECQPVARIFPAVIGWAVPQLKKSRIDCKFTSSLNAQKFLKDRTYVSVAVSNFRKKINEAEESKATKATKVKTKIPASLILKYSSNRSRAWAFEKLVRRRNLTFNLDAPFSNFNNPQDKKSTEKTQSCKSNSIYNRSWNLAMPKVPSDRPTNYLGNNDKQICIISKMHYHEKIKPIIQQQNLEKRLKSARSKSEISGLAERERELKDCKKEQRPSNQTNVISYKNNKQKLNRIPLCCSLEQKLMPKYKFVIGSGNNGELIKQLLQARGNWKQTLQHDTLFNLKWAQYTEQSLYSKMNFSRYRQMVNHIENHAEISSKAGLIKTIKQFCSRNKMQVFDLLPLSFVFSWEDFQQLEGEMKKFVFYYHQNRPSLVSTDKQDRNSIFSKEREYIEIIKSIKDKETVPNFSFGRIDITKYPPLTGVFKAGDQYLWIIKPSSSNRGHGIKIFSTLGQLSMILKEWHAQKSSDKEFVIQKYIERPLLIDGRKFDIRVWMLIDNHGKGYLFQQGYIRTSSEKFTISRDRIEDKCMHLTNNAVQKNGQNYGIFEEGNQLSFDDFDRIFPDNRQGSQESEETQNLETHVTPFRHKILPQIRETCALVLEAAQKTMMSNVSQVPSAAASQGPHRPKKSDLNSKKANNIAPNSFLNTFQIFGLDFMIDQSHKLWLIQVNTNPCIEITSKLLSHLIPRMLDDAFKLVLDPIFKPSPRDVNLNANCHFQVSGYRGDENLWQELKWSGVNIPEQNGTPVGNLS